METQNLNTSEDNTIRVKHLIQYLQSFDPNMEVTLNRDSWYHSETIMETIKNSYIFSKGFSGKLVVNN
jgi:hypothetical protein